MKMKSKPQHIKTGPYSGKYKAIVKNTMHFSCGQDIPEALGFQFYISLPQRFLLERRPSQNSNLSLSLVFLQDQLKRDKN